jgi:hypothetical protein
VSDAAETAKFIKDGLTVLWKIRQGLTTADFWESACDANLDRVSLIYVDTGLRYTYAEVEFWANKVANWARGVGLGKGSVVALLMENRPEYIFTWLGLAKVGCAAALINNGLRGKSLVHCISIAGAGRVIVSPACAAAAAEVADELPAVEWLRWDGDGSGSGSGSGGGGGFGSSFDAALALSSSARPHKTAVRGDLQPFDLMWLIYTSGTTGLPKAAKINHTRLYSAGLMYAQLYGVTRRDVVYCPLPLYHSAGGNIGVGLSWHTGGTLVLRSKFRWRDPPSQHPLTLQVQVERPSFPTPFPAHPLTPRAQRLLLLARLRRARRHGGTIHRRAVPLPAERAFRAGGQGTPRAAGHRQRPAAGHLVGLPRALRHRRDRGVLRRNGGDVRAVQQQEQAWRYRAP